MFVPPRKQSTFYVLTTLEGSILPKIWRRVLYTMLLSAAVNYSHGHLWDIKIMPTPALFTVMGLTLAIFLGFRNTVSYDRFWEWRKLWGQLMIDARSFARECMMFAPQVSTQELRYRIYLMIAFVYTLKHHVRGTSPYEDLRPLLWPRDVEKIMAANNRPNMVLHMLGQMLGEWRKNGIEPQYLARMEMTLDSLSVVQGGCERILSTPIPHPYLLLLHRTVHVYCFLLPFALTDSIGILTPLVVGMVSYTFFGLDAIGEEIANPFEAQEHDLPLDAMSRTIEINLREQMGETDLPSSVEPRDRVLT